MEGWIFKNGASGDGDYSRVGGWKGGFSKMGQAEMVMAYDGRPDGGLRLQLRPFAFLNFSGWEGGRVDFQKEAKR